MKMKTVCFDRELLLLYEKTYRALKKACKTVGVEWDTEIDTLREKIYEIYNGTNKREEKKRADQE